MLTYLLNCAIYFSHFPIKFSFLVTIFFITFESKDHLQHAPPYAYINTHIHPCVCTFILSPKASFTLSIINFHHHSHRENGEGKSIFSILSQSFKSEIKRKSLKKEELLLAFFDTFGTLHI